MDLISFFKTMKCEDVSKDLIVFRSSKYSLFFSILFIVAGSLLLVKTTLYFMKGGWIVIAFLGNFVGSLFCLIAIVIFSTYRKIIIDIKNKKIRYFGKCSVLTTKETVFHFNEILQIEVYPCKEIIFSWGVNIWKIKLYLKRGNKYCAICIFENKSLFKVLEHAEILHKIINVSVVKPDLINSSYYEF